MKRHHVDIAEADGVLYARCRCGWQGKRHDPRAAGRDEAYRAAERDARAHEATADQPDPQWRERAACRDLDTEAFFPLGTTGRALDQTEEAKAVCADCPVSTDCLGWAMATNQQDGIWGGYTEDERRALRRKRRWT